MKAAVIAALLAASCSNLPTFESYSTREQIALGQFAPTRIPAEGLDWKMEGYLRYADTPEIAHVNFAGRYSVFPVGCGTECLEYSIIDRATGAVYMQDTFEQAFPAEWDGPSGIHFRPDSRLLTVYWAEGFQ